MTEFLTPMEANGFEAFKSPTQLILGENSPIDAQIPKQEAEDEQPTNNPSAENSDGPEKAPRLPRWTRQEILVLIEGKKVVESRGKKSRVIVDGHVSTESKWASISSYCKRHGVNREPVQCRKRWSNLSGDFKKIRDWEDRFRRGENDVQSSFWGMRNDMRRENKLPGFFDREVYDVLGNYADVGKREEEEEMGRREISKAAAVVEPVFDVNRREIGKKAAAAAAAVVVEPIFDSNRAEEGNLFSSDFEEDVELPRGSTGGAPAGAATPDKDKEAALESPTTTARTPPPPPPLHARAEKVPTPVAEKGSASCASGQKRKRSSSEGESDSDLRDQLLSVLERNSRVLTAHVESQNLNCQLDRNQRKDHADSLIVVLGKLADALGRIADKL